MPLILRVEEIFDAATDDAQFDMLSTKLAAVLGARSGVIHWRLHEDEAEQEVSYSGHFSSEDMAKFEGDFTRDDIWADAVNAPHALNRVWRLQDLVPPAKYERSRIYNEWIRSIGDDTMHALGTVIHTPEFRVELGFHRGRSQPEFDAETVAQLSHYLPSIRRMILIRQRLRAERRGAASVALDQIAHACFTLSPKGRVLHMNRKAEAMVRGGEVLKVRHGQLHARAAAEDARLMAMIASASVSASQGEALMLRGHGANQFSAALVPALVGSARQIVLIVSDLNGSDPGLASRLGQLYGLSTAEAAIALLLAEGLSLTEIADRRATAIGTVRAQTKAVASKLGAGRQSEIVRLVLSLPRFGT